MGGVQTRAAEDLCWDLNTGVAAMAGNHVVWGLPLLRSLERRRDNAGLGTGTMRDLSGKGRDEMTLVGGA